MSRRNQTAAIRFGPVLNVLIVCTLLAGAGLGYVWQKKSIEQLTQRHSQKLTELENLERNIKNLSASLEFMTRPEMIEQIVRLRKLGLEKPAPEQIITLIEPNPRSQGRPAPTPSLARSH